MSYSDEFIKIMDYIGSKIGIAIDWTSQNIMPYFAELMERVVKYEIMTSMAWIGISIVLILIAFALLQVSKKKRIDSDAIIAFKILLVFVSAFGFLVVATQVFDIIEALTIPEMTFYDYVKTISYKFS